MDAAAMNAEKPPRRKSPPFFNKGAFYRFARMAHGYLSAFAFVALIFFAGTGLLLNHPEWFKGQNARNERTITLPMQSKTHVRGAYSSGDIIEPQAMLRFEGVSGSSDVTIDLDSGRAEVSTQNATAVSMLHDLHRGRKAGQVWRGLIDIVAAVVLLLSLIGYVLFFSLRHRLASSLVITVVGAIALIGVFIAFAP
jgi:hypothetical protein